MAGGVGVVDTLRGKQLQLLRDSIQERGNRGLGALSQESRVEPRVREPDDGTDVLVLYHDRCRNDPRWVCDYGLIEENVTPGLRGGRINTSTTVMMTIL